MFANQQLLYQSLKNGEDAAFEYLYQLLYQRIAGYIYLSGGTRDNTKHVVHESIITFLFNLHYEKYQWREEAELMTYVVSIARHKWSEMNRKSARPVSLDVTTLPPDVEPVSGSDVDELDFEKRRLLVEQNLKHLGEKCQRCIDLFYFQKKSMQEIAVRLGWANEDVAKKEKYRCLKKLRQLIGLRPWE
jgi:RNA polymerase sigma factor (sigma-70 family)